MNTPLLANAVFLFVSPRQTNRSLACVAPLSRFLPGNSIVFPMKCGMTILAMIGPTCCASKGGPSRCPAIPPASFGARWVIHSMSWPFLFLYTTDFHQGLVIGQRAAPLLLRDALPLLA